MNTRRTSRRWKLPMVAAVVGAALFAGTADATPSTPMPGYVSSTLAIGHLRADRLAHRVEDDQAALAGDDQDQGLVGPVRPAEHVGPDGLRVHPDHRLAHPRRTEPGDRHRSARSPPTTATTRRARRTSTRPARRTTSSSTPATGTSTSCATRAAPQATTIAVQLIPSGAPRREDVRSRRATARSDVPDRLPAASLTRTSRAEQFSGRDPYVPCSGTLIRSGCRS